MVSIVPASTKTRNRTSTPYLLIITLALSFQSALHADGLPVSKDLTRLECSCTTLKLNSQQIREVELFRVVTLTKSQRAVLHVMCPRAWKRFPILTSRYDDCTCGMGPTAVWCRPGELDFPNDLIYQDRFYGAQDIDGNPIKEPSPPKASSKKPERLTGSDSITVDSKGSMFMEGHPITEQELDKLVVQYTKAADAKHKEYLFLDLPPPVSPEIDEKVRELAFHIEALAGKFDMTVYIEGLTKIQEAAQKPSKRTE